MIEFWKSLFTTQMRWLLVFSNNAKLVFMTSPQSVPRVLTLQGGVWRGCRSLTFSQGQKFQTEGEEYFELQVNGTPWHLQSSKGLSRARLSYSQ